jgi:hypothetical protein
MKPKEDSYSFWRVFITLPINKQLLLKLFWKEPNDAEYLH